MSFGVMGGEYQAFGHMQFLTRLFDYGMDVQEAQDMPRFFPDPFSDVVEVEEPITNEMRDALQALGHNIQPAHKLIGGVASDLYRLGNGFADCRIGSAQRWLCNGLLTITPSFNIQHDMDIIHRVTCRIVGNFIAVGIIEIINDLVRFSSRSLI